MISRRVGRIVTLAAVLCLVSTACGGDGGDEGTRPRGTAREPLRIGYAAALSGFAAIADVPALEGVEYQVELLNNEGGIDGHPIELIVKDMESDPGTGTRVTQELIDQGVSVILSVPFAGLMIPVAETAATANVPILSPTNTAPEGAATTDNAFQAAFGDNWQAAAVAEFALTQGHRTSVIVESPDDTYTLNTPRWFAEVFEQGGGKNVSSETFSIGQEDFTALATKLANLSPQPDVIYTSMFMPDLGVFVKQIRAAGVESALYGADGFDNAELITFARKDTEGLAFSTHAFARPGTRFEKFIDGLRDFQGEAPEAPALAGLGADSILLIKTAVEQAGSTDPGALLQALSRLQGVPVVTTESVTFAGTAGIPEKSVIIAGVEDGQFVFREEITPRSVPEPNPASEG